jgi:hypothetical protein
MDVWSFFYFLLVFLMVICIALSCHGLNPIRLIRSSLKAPQLYLGHNHLHTTMTSNRTEKETLLPIKRSIQYSDTNPRLYTHVMEDLRQCFHSTQDINEFLGDLDLKTLIDTPLKARHFAHVLCHHRMEEDSSFSIFHQFSISTISKIIVSFLKFSKEEPIAQCIKQCFLSQTAKQLIVLKNEVEQFLSLYHLIYKKLRSKKIRQEILNHFQQEANQLLLKEEPQFQRPFKLIWYVSLNF